MVYLKIYVLFDMTLIFLLTLLYIYIYIYLNLIMSIIPTLYFFCRIFIWIKSFLKNVCLSNNQSCGSFYDHTVYQLFNTLQAHSVSLIDRAGGAIWWNPFATVLFTMCSASAFYIT